MPRKKTKTEDERVMGFRPMTFQDKGSANMKAVEIEAKTVSDTKTAEKGLRGIVQARSGRTTEPKLSRVQPMYDPLFR